MSKTRRKERDRPAPIMGIEAAYDRVPDARSRRSDRFSQLLSRAVRDERHGDVLMTTSGLTRQEHEELARLTPAAHEDLGVELVAAIARLRGLLTAGDPFFIMSVVQDANFFVPWGEYYEPTREGLESRVELAAGLLATQPVVATRDRPTAEAMQAILDEIDHSAELICGHDPSLDASRVRAILSELAVTVGSLDPASYRGLFDPNPLRDRPFLEHEGEYLLGLPGAMTRDIDTLLEFRVVKGSPGVSKQRAKTLDRLAVEYLSRLLPGAATHTNLHYEGTELDGLVLFERTALVVEGKGSGISVQGQRGDTARLRRDIETLSKTRGAEARAPATSCCGRATRSLRTSVVSRSFEFRRVRYAK